MFQLGDDKESQCLIKYLQSILIKTVDVYSKKLEIFMKKKNGFSFLPKENCVRNQCSSLIDNGYEAIFKNLVFTSSTSSSRNVAISNCLLAGCMSRLYYSTLILNIW